MAIKLLRQGSKTDYYYKEWYIDTTAELKDLPIADAAPGSVAFIVNTGQVYILNNKKVWKEV